MPDAACELAVVGLVSSSRRRHPRVVLDASSSAPRHDDSPSEEDADVWFCIGDDEVPCIRSNIAALSQPLSTLLYGGFAEAGCERINFTRNGISACEMKAVEVFSRTGCLDDFPPDTVLELLSFANKFCCAGLKSAYDAKLASLVRTEEDAALLVEYGIERPRASLSQLACRCRRAHRRAISHELAGAPACMRARKLAGVRARKLAGVRARPASARRSPEERGEVEESRGKRRKKKKREKRESWARREVKKEKERDDAGRSNESTWMVSCQNRPILRNKTQNRPIIRKHSFSPHVEHNTKCVYD